MPKPLPGPADVHTVVLDFDGVFTDNAVWVDADGHEWVRCDRRDGLAFDIVRALKRRGEVTAELFILSKERNSLVSARARKLQLPCHEGVGDKLAFVRQYLSSRFPQAPDPFAGLVYLGNDLNDLPVMRYAGYTVAPADAHPMVQRIADIVLPQRGGDGFVRAFMERWLRIDQLTNERIDELVSDR